MKRYQRQVILPQIGIEGQKKLQHSTVVIESQSVECCSFLLYYLAAAGIGCLLCDLAEEEGLDSLSKRIRALNPEVEVIAAPAQLEKLPGAAVKVIQGSLPYVQSQAQPDKGIPLIIATTRGWQGWLEVIKSPASQGPAFTCSDHKPAPNTFKGGVESVFASNLLGALAAVEVVKVLLDLGRCAEEGLAFDLFKMEFARCQVAKACPSSLTQHFLTTNIPGKSPAPVAKVDLHKLRQGRILVVGTGGLGSPVLYTLVKAGVGTVGLVDSDRVDITNLNRQVLHSQTRLGVPKVDSAEVFLRELNPTVNLIKYNTRLAQDNASEIISNFDVVVACVDNLDTRRLINEAAAQLGKPMVEAGVNGFEGIAATIWADRSACYQCLFPAPAALDCNIEPGPEGILGPVAGVLGTIQGCEACKLLISRGDPLFNSLLAYDALEAQFEIYHTDKDPDCPVCTKF